MGSLSSVHPVRGSVATETSSKTSGVAPRLQRTQAVVVLISEATLSFVTRFLDRRDPLGQEFAAEARDAQSEFQGFLQRDSTGSGSNGAQLDGCRRHTARLLTAFEVFLDQRRLRRWMKDDPEARQVRTVGQRFANGHVEQKSPGGIATYSEWLDQPDPGVAANTIVCLIHQANYLLDRQILLLRQGFRPAPELSRTVPLPQAGPVGSSERASFPSCPECGLPMIERIARRGPRAGRQFWGCTAYPKCHGIRANGKTER